MDRADRYAYLTDRLTGYTYLIDMDHFFITREDHQPVTTTEQPACGAKGAVPDFPVPTGIPGHNEHTCVRTDGSDHLGLHQCACGAPFSVGPDRPTPPQEHDWAAAVNRRLDWLEAVQAELDRSVTVSDSKAVAALTAVKLVNEVTAVLNRSCHHNAMTLDGLDARVIVLDERLRAVENAFDSASAYKDGATALATQVHFHVDEMARDGASGGEILRAVLTQMHHVSAGHASSADDDAESGLGLSWGPDEACTPCTAAATALADQIERQSGKDTFFNWLDTTLIDVNSRDIAKRINEKVAVEAATGAPPVMVLRYIVAESVHTLRGHRKPRYGWDCLSCLGEAKQLAQGRMSGLLAASDLYYRDLLVGNQPQPWPDTVTKVDVPTGVEHYQLAPAPFGPPQATKCGRRHETAPIEKGSYLCGTCGFRVDQHLQWPHFEAMKPMIDDLIDVGQAPQTAAPTDVDPDVADAERGEE